MKYTSIKSFTDLESFKIYMSELNQNDHVYYLREIEDQYPELMCDNYRHVFEPFDIQLMMEQPTEVATRIFYIFNSAVLNDLPDYDMNNSLII